MHIRFIPLTDREEIPEQNQEFYFCEDIQKNHQAMMAIAIDTGIHILAITSNPWNTFYLGKQDFPVKGAGSLLIMQAIKRAIQLRKGQIHLKARLSAVAFYEKLGFVPNFKVPNPTTTLPMILTSDKIWHLYPHLIFSTLAA